MTYREWLVATATINGCDWEDAESSTSRSLFVGHFTVAFSYEVDGNRYRGKFHSSHAWEAETEVPILYKPRNPGESCVCDQDESQIVPAFECFLEMLGGAL